MNFSNGKKITSKEMKRTIMKANRWSEEEYSKKYHLFKNKLRAYESFMWGHGRMVRVQSPVELLYKQARSKLTYGKGYQPTNEMKLIQSFSAVSITKGRRLAGQAGKGTKYESRIFKAMNKQTLKSFGALIKATDEGKEIAAKIKDPLKLMAALSELSKYIEQNRAKIIKQSKGELFANEYVGSDVLAEDFDYSMWL